ncbi:hypothetical protein ACFE04_011767 [Oxalis oulophora]
MMMHQNSTRSSAADDVINRLILPKIHPTKNSLRKRQHMIEYVQAFIRDTLGVEVFPYGSVPLKTYLYDGDIDLTAFCSPEMEPTLYSDVFAIMKRQECNQDRSNWFRVMDVKGIDAEVCKGITKGLISIVSPFCLSPLMDVKGIDAEVKLVKCIINDVVVDISFNQIGGLRTLCFLEQVDRMIGKDHLYKRSIILIKGWCCYESRLLGAHHGLLSTYALETLVLYIILVDSSATSPLSVLVGFLDYFSKFDWENHCFSLNGPVCRSSLPQIVAAYPEISNDKPFRRQEFLQKCVDMFSIPSGGFEFEKTSRAFPQKFMNIIDPLNKSNNLGRSVSKGNFHRICSAFKYGADKLGQILLLPNELITAELKSFFVNSLERYESSLIYGSLNQHESSVSAPGDTMLDLRADVDSDYWSVLYGHYFYLCSAASRPLQHNPPLPPRYPPLPSHSMNSEDRIRYLMESTRRDQFEDVRSFHHHQSHAIEQPKLQRTDNYFSNMNMCSNGGMTSHGEGRFPRPAARSRSFRFTADRRQPMGQASTSKSPLSPSGSGVKAVQSIEEAAMPVKREPMHNVSSSSTQAVPAQDIPKADCQSNEQRNEVLSSSYKHDDADFPPLFMPSSTEPDHP